MTSRAFQDRLSRRARKAGIRIDAAIGEKLEVYYRLLSIWNDKINLTGLKLADPTPLAIDRLLIEPLIAVQHIPFGTRTAIDIGSGGGSPAVPVAIAVSGLRMVMVEAKTRKCVFLREVARALQIDRLEIRTARFEELLTAPDLHESHDLLTIRAVRVEPRTLMSLQAFVRPGGELFLFRSTTTPSAFTLTPPLHWKATYPLLDSPPGSLVILEKRDVAGAAPGRRST